MLDGYLVPDREHALHDADIVITVTGAQDVVTAADLPALKDAAILVNAGHIPWEIDLAGLSQGAEVESDEGVTTIRLRDGRRLHVLADGHMVNLAGPRPLGNSIESMDIGFALQVRCLEAVARGEVGAESCVVPVPRRIDEAVAAAFVGAR
jgi:adenosylhomocysteinase